jgi:hypothetical protein
MKPQQASCLPCLWLCSSVSAGEMVSGLYLTQGACRDQSAGQSSGFCAKKASKNSWPSVTLSCTQPSPETGPVHLWDGDRKACPRGCQGGFGEIMQVKCLAYSQCLIQGDPLPSRPAAAAHAVPPGITNPASSLMSGFDNWPFDLLQAAAAISWHSSPAFTFFPSP